MHWFWRLLLTVVLGNILCFIYLCFPLHTSFALRLSDVLTDWIGVYGEVLSFPLVLVTPPMLVVIGIWSFLGRGKSATIHGNETRCRECGEAI